MDTLYNNNNNIIILYNNDDEDDDDVWSDVGIAGRGCNTSSRANCCHAVLTERKNGKYDKKS